MRARRRPSRSPSASGRPRAPAPTGRRPRAAGRSARAATAGRTSRRRAASRTRPGRAGGRGPRARPPPRTARSTSSAPSLQRTSGCRPANSSSAPPPARWRARWRMSASSTARIASHQGAIARSQYSAIRSTRPPSAAAGSSSSGRATAGASPPVERPAELEPHALGRRRAHARELLARRRAAACAAAGPRSPGCRARGRVQRVEQRVVEPGQAGARLAHPRQVHGVRAGVAQHAHAGHELEQRRDREAGAQEVLAAEAVGDHAGQYRRRFG